MSEKFLALRDVAELLGISKATVASYGAKGMLPEPDVIIGLDARGIHGWRKETIEEWNAQRPGRGRR